MTRQVKYYPMEKCECCHNYGSTQTSVLLDALLRTLWVFLDQSNNFSHLALKRFDLLRGQVVAFNLE